MSGTPVQGHIGGTTNGSSSKSSSGNTLIKDADGNTKQIILGKSTAPTTTTQTGSGGSSTTDASTAPSARYPSSSAASTTVDEAEDAYMKASEAENPTDVARRVQAEFSGEIGSIKNYYAALTSQQQTTNTDESGKARATASASGELGSDMGNALEAAQDKTNNAALQNIVAEEGNAEGAVVGQENSDIDSQVSSERTAAAAAAKDNVAYQQDRATKVQASIATIAGQTDLPDLPQDEYDALYEASGFATPGAFNAYYAAQRQSALTGGKTIGDATSGVWQQQPDGTWKSVIAAPPKIGSIGAEGAYVYDPSTGSVSTIAPAANKIVSSGGVIYSIDPKTNAATPLTSKDTGSGTQGWAATGSGTDQEKAAIMSYLSSLGSSIDIDATIKKIEADPDTYYQALGAASQGGFYTNLNVGMVPGSDDSAATDAATEAEDAANNIELNGDTNSDTGS